MNNFNLVKQSATSLLIQIETEKLSVEEQYFYFGKEYAKIEPTETFEFVQDEDFVFDMDLLLYLGLDTQYHLLKKGHYPLAFVADKVVITLELSENRQAS